MEQAKRYDQLKNRLELIPPTLLNEVGKVLTFGAVKYEDNNWKKGMKWSRCIGSLKRHLTAFESGIDHDEESGLYHLSHVIVNAMFLLEYYKIHPELDDRYHQYLNMPKIGFDVDDVICDFVGGYCKKFNVPTPIHWSCHYDIIQQLGEITSDSDFYLGLKPKINPDDLPFEPHCYITSRSVPQEWTERWIQNNGFPTKPVYTVPFNTSKVEVAKASGIDIFIDDRYENFVELNNAGICTYLFDTPHNRKYNVGYKRIKNLKELIW